MLLANLASKTSGQALGQARRKIARRRRMRTLPQHEKPSLGQGFMKSKIVFAVVTASLAVLTQLHADWPQWRGPGGQGHVESTQLPAEWSEKKNIAWRTGLPGRGLARIERPS